jgi:predicted RNase H-like HicB family nuclease
MKYEIVYEKCASGWGAYVPALPGLGAAAKSRAGIESLIFMKRFVFTSKE